MPEEECDVECIERYGKKENKYVEDEENKQNSTVQGYTGYDKKYWETVHAFKIAHEKIYELKKYAESVVSYKECNYKALLNDLQCTIDNLKIAYHDEEIAARRRYETAGNTIRKRLRSEHFAFSQCGIKIGELIYFKAPCSKDPVPFRVVSDKTIGHDMGEKGESVTAVACRLLGKAKNSGIKALRYFYYHGKNLEKNREEYLIKNSWTVQK